MPGYLQKNPTPLDKEVDVSGYLQRHDLLITVLMKMVKCLIFILLMVAEMPGSCIDSLGGW